ncbi:MAG: hypothetical protein ACTSQH_06950 [Candidatus Hodarchaeales archaeon]
MTKKLLNVSPKFDKPTEVCTLWNEKFLERCKTHNPPIITSLLGEDATPVMFMGNLEESDIIVFFDHGIESALIGHNKSKLITIKDADKLKGKKVFAMACLSAKELGVEAYHKGAKEYWGSLESLGFTMEDHELFGEVFVEGAYQRFCEDRPIEEVYQNMINHFEEQKSKTDNPWTKMWLQSNAEMWVVWYQDNIPLPIPEKGLWEKFISWLKKIFGLDVKIDPGMSLV